MNLEQFLAILKARRSIALAVFLLTVCAAVAVSLLLPKKYTATAEVLVDLAPPDQITGLQVSGMAASAFISTQIDVIKSDRVSGRVISNLGLMENAEIRDEWKKQTNGEGRFEGWLIDELQALLDVKPSRESNIIRVTCKAQNAQFAAQLANGYVRAYLETVLELRVDPARKYTSFFDEQSKLLSERLAQAQARLSAFQREKGLVSTDERLDVETARLNDLSSQLVALQSLSAESGSRQAQVGKQSGMLPEVLSNPVVGSLKADLARAEARLQELTTRLGDNHPQVIEARQSVVETRNRLNAEIGRIGGGVGVTASINRQREAEIRAALDQQRIKVARMKSLRDEASVFVRDVESAQRAYDNVRNRMNQTDLESRATTSNAYVLTEATPPQKPSSPKLLLNTALALVVGAFLALGAVVVLEYGDPRARTVADTSQLLGLPMLGVLPKPGARGAFASRRVPLVMPKIAGRLPAPTKEA